MSNLSEEIRNAGVQEGIEKDRNRIVQRLLNFGKMTVEEIEHRAAFQ